MRGEGEAETTEGFERLREEEDALLLKSGFEPAESDDLWVKECVWYGREAALQEACKAKWGERSGVPSPIT